jgi:hypothetical protein
MKAERVSFWFRFESCPSGGTSVSLLDASGQTFVEFHVNNMSTPVINHQPLQSVTSDAWHYVEFDINFDASSIGRVKLDDQEIFIGARVNQTAGFYEPGTNLRKIVLGHRQPCISRWDNFVVWDRRIPAWE